MPRGANFEQKTFSVGAGQGTEKKYAEGWERIFGKKKPKKKKVTDGADRT